MHYLLFLGKNLQALDSKLVEVAPRQYPPQFGSPPAGSGGAVGGGGSPLPITRPAKPANPASGLKPSLYHIVSLVISLSNNGHPVVFAEGFEIYEENRVVIYGLKINYQ